MCEICNPTEAKHIPVETLCEKHREEYEYALREQSSTEEAIDDAMRREKSLGRHRDAST